MPNTITFQKSYEPLIHKVPFHVLVVYGSLFCSGALVSSRVVLTTASCFLTRTPGTRVFVKLGSDTILALSQIIPVLKIKVHEYYDYPGKLANDIALLLLEVMIHRVPYNLVLTRFFGNKINKKHVKKHVTFTADKKVAKAILARPDDSVNKNELLTVSSWIKASIKSDYESFLVQFRMVVMGAEQCRAALGRLGHHSNFCAQYLGYSMDDLPHDSGSPGLSDNQQISGILSFVLYDEIMFNIGVFTNISYFYRWIMINTKNLHMLKCSSNNTNNNAREKYHVKLYDLQ